MARKFGPQRVNQRSEYVRYRPGADIANCSYSWI
jgi:hypothetical protein